MESKADDLHDLHASKMRRLRAGRSDSESLMSLVFWLILLMVRSKSGDHSPVEVGRLSHYLQGFLHVGWCRISEPSTV